MAQRTKAANKNLQSPLFIRGFITRYSFVRCSTMHSYIIGIKNAILQATINFLSSFPCITQFFVFVSNVCIAFIEILAFKVTHDIRVYRIRSIIVRSSPQLLDYCCIQCKKGKCNGLTNENGIQKSSKPTFCPFLVRCGKRPTKS